MRRPSRPCFAILPVIALMLAPIARAAFSADVRTTLIRAGLSAECMAAAGVTAVEVEGMVEALRDSDAWSGGDLDAADADYRAARGTVDRLTRLIQSGKGTQEDVTALEDARDDLASAEAARTTALDALHAAATAAAATTTRTTLATLRSNAERKVPIEFRAKDRSAEDWRRLRRMLTHERIRSKQGETPDAEVVAELATLRGDAAVALARTNLDTHLASVQAAWDAATEE